MQVETEYKGMGWVTLAITAATAAAKGIVSSIARKKARKAAKREAIRRAITHLKALNIGAQKLGKVLNTIEAQIAAGRLTESERQTYLAQLKEIRDTAIQIGKEASDAANTYSRLWALGLHFEPPIQEGVSMGAWFRSRRKRRRERANRKRRAWLSAFYAALSNTIAQTVKKAKELENKLARVSVPIPVRLPTWFVMWARRVAPHISPTTLYHALRRAGWI